MKTLMRTHRLLSFGASKIATDHAQRAIAAAKQETERQALERQLNADLGRYGKATYTMPTK